MRAGAGAKPTPARNRAAVAVGAAFVAVNVVAFVHGGGSRLGQDSFVYLGGADALLDGDGLTSRQVLSIGYVGLLAVVRELGIGLDWVVFLQVLVAGVAGVALFDIGRRLGGPWVGLGASALFLANPEFAWWNQYVLADSLYISLAILSAWAVLRATGAPGRGHLIALALIAAAVTIRPNGWLLVAATGIFWFLRMRAGRARRLAGAGLVAIVVSGLAVVASLPDTFDPARFMRVGRIGYQEKLDVPKHPRGDGLTGAAEYAWAHPGVTARLAGARVGWELAHARRRYSVGHKVAIAIWLPLLYAFAIAGFARARRHPVAVLAALLTALQLGLVAASFADYDGRYLLYFLPLLGVVSAYGFAGALERVRD
jgi:4-amino-4-deoxy-L-arabinose transferase-like glycosyltransferase